MRFRSEPTRAVPAPSRRPGRVLAGAVAAVLAAALGVITTPGPAAATGSAIPQAELNGVWRLSHCSPATPGCDSRLSGGTFLSHSTDCNGDRVVHTGLPTDPVDGQMYTASVTAAFAEGGTCTTARQTRDFEYTFRRQGDDRLLTVHEVGSQYDGLYRRAGAVPPADDCGLTHDQAVQLALSAGLSAAEAEAFAQNPCDLMTDAVSGPVELTDDGVDESVVAGPAGPARCKIARGKVRLITALATIAAEVELASYDMVTYFCYDGSTVWKKGEKGSPPPEAAVQNVQYTAAGTLYQVEYLATASTPTSNGWYRWARNGNDRGAAFTTITTNWQAGLPILKWAVPERASVTRTLNVFADGNCLLN